MAILGSVTTTLHKAVPASKGIIQNSVTGVGFDQVAKTIDNMVGSPVQKIFSFNVPFLGSAGPIDLMNYFVHANGLKLSKNGFIAVLAAKIVQGVLPSIGGIKLPGTSVAQVNKTTSVASGARGAPM